MCLGSINEKPKVSSCGESDDNQIWIIYQDGTIRNKGTEYCLKAEKKNIKLSTCPNVFQKKYIFVYNEFHKTIIAADPSRKFGAITSSLKIKGYLATGTISLLNQWTYKRV